MEENRQNPNIGVWPFKLATYFTSEAKELGSVEAAIVAGWLRKDHDSKEVNDVAEVLYPIEIDKIADQCGMTNDRVINSIKILLNSGVNYHIHDFNDKFVIADWRNNG